jgi:hypothetical protein
MWLAMLKNRFKHFGSCLYKFRRRTTSGGGGRLFNVIAFIDIVPTAIDLYLPRE